jgi:hypothetical protein
MSCSKTRLTLGRRKRRSAGVCGDSILIVKARRQYDLLKELGHGERRVERCVAQVLLGIAAV